MGCTVSQTPDASNPGARPTQNGIAVNGDVNHNIGHSETNGAIPNGNKLKSNTANQAGPDTKNSKDERNRTLKGDLSQRNEARIRREKTLHEMFAQKELKAQKISELMMEEKERLSLSTSRSRATSRTGSPKLHRDNQSSKSVPLSIATGDSFRPITTSLIEPAVCTPEPSTGRAGSQESLNRTDPNLPRPSALKSNNGRRKKGEPKVRIVTDSSDSKDNHTDEWMDNGGIPPNKRQMNGLSKSITENQAL